MSGASPGDIDVRPVADDDWPVVERLWQLYWHDLSESRGSVPNEHGLFKTAHLEAYRGHPDATDSFLVTYGGAPAGFTFVSRLDGPFRSIGDFFIVRAVRRRGVGRVVALDLIRRYPGGWEIAFQAENRGAPEFWRGVAAELVGDAWREELRPVPDKPQIPPDHWLIFEVK